MAVAGCLGRWLALLRKKHPSGHIPYSGNGLYDPSVDTMLTTWCSGVAVGSSIGHAVGGWFSGGSSAQPATAEASQPIAQDSNGAYAMNQNYAPPAVCGTDVSNFRKCMDDNQGNLTVCGWYLDQLKACQAAAGQY